MAAPSSHDLTPTLGRFLDRHLLLPLLDFLSSRELFAREDLERSKLAVLLKTNMLDLAVDIHTSLHKTKEVPPNLATRREEVLANMQRLKAEVEPILAIVGDPGRVEELKRDRSFNQAFFVAQLNISAAQIEVLQTWAKFLFECGDYAQAAQLLSSYRMLTTDSDKSFSALWGKLASEILNGSWDAALEDLNALRDAIDSRTSTAPAMMLQQRCWLMHWALFLLGNHPNGRSILADLFLQDKWLQALQANAPHLLRYLAVAVVTNPRRRDKMRDVVRVIGMERANYSDPITAFLEDLHTHANFSEAQERLTRSTKIIKLV